MFEGSLKADGRQWDMPFKAKIGTDGEIEFDIAPLPLTRETFEIKRLWSEARGPVYYFELSGKAAEGIRFESARLFFSAVRTKATPDESHLELKARCSIATITQPMSEPTGKLAVLQYLRGFECFDHLHAQCPLGDISMTGMTPLPENDKLSGVLQITRDTPPEDLTQWHKDVQKLFDHVRHIMSFAASRHIKAPTTQTWMDQTFKTEVISQTSSRDSGMRVIHFLDLEPVFETAVASFFAPPVAAKKLYFAIEWFAMHASYSETRLLNAMTALENLTNANLEKNEKAFLPAKRFRSVAEMMHQAVPIPACDEEIAFRASLCTKMQDLNRRPLLEKITVLAKRWNVPLDDLPPDSLQGAISARNKVVHRGHYYDETEREKQESLWAHVVVIREIVARMVFAALGFRGRYLSRLGGSCHDAFYPPPSTSSKAVP